MGAKEQALMFKDYLEGVKRARLKRSMKVIIGKTEYVSISEAARKLRINARAIKRCEKLGLLINGESVKILKRGEQ